MRGRLTSGFTLLELLVVMTIIGIVAGVLGFSLLNNLRRTQLQSAAAQLSADLRLTRTNAQKTGLMSAVTVVAGGTTYTAQTRPTQAQTRSLENGITLVPDSSSLTTVKYYPPFGTLATTGTLWELRSPTTWIPSVFLKVVGVTGKVMISAARD
ncbi:type II secretion system protein GspH [Deinococcus sp. Arct2-2]|uniref:prepilin-type N-terminal cleavage/methylation domain-containing protein n=1 Tax=Deinococcus sp. Arct2-2 TaxID=2568653 RepID=UPI0010A2F204|nr:prepilin-type N-terminal cleavage/methylation domain-containing protein [Deinococcus sp. Arct2-2]THF68123.1 type II secretion system protein GspH [Deinococcus sp. Arct2-2]